MADQTPAPIPTVRRLLHMAIDETCQRLAACPPIPAGAKHSTLSGGSIVIVPATDSSPQERWRCNADGSVREYTRFKTTSEHVPGKCPWSEAWWAV